MSDIIRKLRRMLVLFFEHISFLFFISFLFKRNISFAGRADDERDAGCGESRSAAVVIPNASKEATERT